MLTLEIKINGVIIGVVKLVNTGMKIKDDVMYGLEAYIPDDEYNEGKFISTSVAHNPDEGAIVLVQKAVNQIVEKL